MVKVDYPIIASIPSSTLHPILKKHGGEAVPKGEPAFLFGSLGLIEIAVREGSAYYQLNVRPGDRIKIDHRFNS